MIIIPEIETVVILVPRTGTGSLRRAIAEKYPRSMLIYRHMEADGVPPGYDRWERVGCVRHPIDRLWSLYKFLADFGGRTEAGQHQSAYIEAMRVSVGRPFNDWIVNNEVVFTSPYDRSGEGRYFPGYTVRHPLPENRKSQFLYLRPDLGTKVYRYSDGGLLRRLGVEPTNEIHRTEDRPPPIISPGAYRYLKREFAWDFANA